MRVLIVTPAPAGSQKGNRITALRWEKILHDLGHQVSVADRFDGRDSDLLVALHARRSAGCIRRFHTAYPDRPIILALTGTDLYKDIHHSASARRSLDIAARLIILQPEGLRELERRYRTKARVIYQSIPADVSARPLKSVFEVCVLGHLRPVKDPFRAAMAVRSVPATSKLKVIQIGGALTDSMRQRATAESGKNPRYEWLGELPRRKALRRLARARLLALTSKLEGGANAITEAVVTGVPVISSRIAGSIGLLGKDYPGYFPVGDTKALRDLLLRAEQDQQFYEQLRAECRERRPLFEPAAEHERWRDLLTEFNFA